MPIIPLLIILAAAGFILWLCNRFIPMEGTVKIIFNAVCILLILVFLLKAFGVWGWLMNARV